RAILLEEIEEIESFQRSYKKERSSLDIEIRAINLTIKELHAASSYATEHASSAHKAFTLTMHATGATHTEETVGEALYKTLAKLPHDIEETPIATLNNHFTLTAATPRNLFTINPPRRLAIKERSEEHTSELQSRENLVCC